MSKRPQGPKAIRPGVPSTQASLTQTHHHNVRLVPYTFSCASGGNHTCHRWTSAGDRPWHHNDGTECASCSGAYRKTMFPSSEKREASDQNLFPKTSAEVNGPPVLSQQSRRNHRKSFVQTFVFKDITDKTHVQVSSLSCMREMKRKKL